MKIIQSIGIGEITLKIDGFNKSILVKDQTASADGYPFPVFVSFESLAWLLEGADTIEGALKIAKRAISSMYQEFQESKQN